MDRFYCITKKVYGPPPRPNRKAQKKPEADSANASAEKKDSSPDQAGSGMVTPDKSNAQSLQTVPGTNGTTSQKSSSPEKKLIRDDSARAKGKRVVLNLLTKKKDNSQQTKAIAQATLNSQTRQNGTPQPTNVTGRQQSLGACQESTMLNKTPKKRVLVRSPSDPERELLIKKR